ncbi:dicarboxylate/amino acid:cation symporter [Brevibacterium pigmentatum]|uniref:dicarboxylate/amino acid:cation symporter n=1 Tax=Brevibacterium pigmentatum TaxID=1496080 RepID=UPI0014245B8F|nr:dicarboxylate/amino acid:cation symporter [Brevibacterium pigmentatum]
MSRIFLRIWRRYRDTALFLKMTAGFVLGLFVAFVFGEKAQVLSPIGDILLNLLQLIVIPIIMVTLIHAVNSTRSGNLVRVAFKTFAFYILTTIAAVVISLSLALLVNPGTGLQRPDNGAETPEAPSFVDQLVGVFPENIFKALVDGNILALIFVAIVVGITMAGMRRSSDSTICGFGKLLYDLVLAAEEMTFRILAGILQFAPFGIAALVASDIGSQGLDALAALGKLAGVVYAGLAAQILLIYIPLLLFNRIPVGGFFRVAGAPMATAFTTQSSSGTIPVSLEATRKAGILQEVAGFVIPLGATINMDGAVIRLGASVVLAANIAGHDLTVLELGAIVLTATFVSIGTAGVPGAGLIGLTILLQQAGLPLETVALVAGVDVLLGMGATMINITGDLVGAHLIDKSEKRAGGRQSDSKSVDDL